MPALCSNYSTPDIDFGGNLFFNNQTNLLFINLYLDLCGVDPVNCYNASYWEMQTAKFKYLLFFNDAYPQMQTVEGYQSFTDFVFFDFSYQTVNVDIILKKNVISTDNNALFNFNPNVVDSFFYYDQITETFSDRVNLPSNILQINILYYIQNQQLFYQRVYTKLDAVLANTNVMFALFLLVGRLVNNFINWGGKEYYIMKNLYIFKQTDATNQAKDTKGGDIIRALKRQSVLSNVINIKENDDKEINTQRVMINSQISQDIGSDRSRAKYDTPKRKEEEMMSIDHMKKKFVRNNNEHFEKKTFLFFFSSCLMFWRHSNCNRNWYEYMETYTIGALFLKFDMNIIIMLRKLIELENIKKILFNEYQLEMIKFVMNRQIENENTVREKLTEIRDSLFINGTEELEEKFQMSYKKCVKNVKKRENKRILKLFK